MVIDLLSILLSFFISFHRTQRYGLWVLGIKESMPSPTLSRDFVTFFQ